MTAMPARNRLIVKLAASGQLLPVEDGQNLNGGVRGGGGRRHRDIVRRKVEPDSCPGGGLGPGPTGMARPSAGPGLYPFATVLAAAVAAAVAAAAAAQHCLCGRVSPQDPSCPWHVGWPVATSAGGWRGGPEPPKHPMHTQNALLVLKKAGAD